MFLIILDARLRGHDGLNNYDQPKQTSNHKHAAAQTAADKSQAKAEIANGHNSASRV